MKPNAPNKKNNVRKITHPVKVKQSAPSGIVTRNERMWILILFLLAFALYANTIPGKYLMDDYSVLSDNFVVKRGIEGIPTIMQTPYRCGFNLLSDNLYRPLSQVLFAIEWQVAPATPSLSHFINVLFYALT